MERLGDTETVGLLVTEADPDTVAVTASLTVAVTGEDTVSDSLTVGSIVSVSVSGRDTVPVSVMLLLPENVPPLRETDCDSDSDVVSVGCNDTVCDSVTVNGRVTDGDGPVSVTEREADAVSGRVAVAVVEKENDTVSVASCVRVGVGGGVTVGEVELDSENERVSDTLRDGVAAGVMLIVFVGCFDCVNETEKSPVSVSDIGTVAVTLLDVEAVTLPLNEIVAVSTIDAVAVGFNVVLAESVTLCDMDNVVVTVGRSDSDRDSVRVRETDTDSLSVAITESDRVAGRLSVNEYV